LVDRDWWSVTVMNAIRIALFTAAALLVVPANAQDPRVKEMETLAQSVKADKKAIVSKAMLLTDAEAKGFWPVYEAYQKDLQALNDRLVKLVVAYADVYEKGPVSDETAKKLVQEMIAIEEQEVKLKRDYLPRLEKVLPGAKVARYLQIESKIRAVIRYELAANIPLAE
jgi:polyhydroxyalkanoate synthesis regulator phasin